MSLWQSFIDEEKKQNYLSETLAYINAQRDSGTIVYPNDSDIFSAFDLTPFEKVNVVILGQDPYHGENQAHGLSFSVLPDVKTPPSLVNIYKELATDIEGFNIPNHGYLKAWAEQGVLLLNTVLTVEAGKAHSHKHLGWEKFTNKVIQKLNDEREGVIFLLWGSHAKKKGKNIDTKKHHVIAGPHPSPLSAYRGFFGCKHFSKTNQLLNDMGKMPINWQV